MQLTRGMTNWFWVKIYRCEALAFMLLIGLSVNRMLTSSSIEIEIRTSHLNGILFKVRHCDSECIEGILMKRSGAQKQHRPFWNLIFVLKSRVWHSNNARFVSVPLWSGFVVVSWSLNWQVISKVPLSGMQFYLYGAPVTRSFPNSFYN